MADAYDNLIKLLPPLLRSLDGLAFIARHLHPPRLAEVLAAAGEPDLELARSLPDLAGWPSELRGVADRFDLAGQAVLEAYSNLRGAAEAPDGLRAVFRALRGLPKAQELLYPLAQGLAPLSRYFLDGAWRDHPERVDELAQAPTRDDVGVFHIENEPGSRGGFSLYVPEDYSEDRDWPLVVALHGGSGNGRAFLWTWLGAARAQGAILISPTARGDTWALAGPDVDTPNLNSMVGHVSARWRLDPKRRLLTGMSDGGTFSYVSGLESDCAFTHLAPVSAAFHPFLAEMADPDRLAGLPIHITHGSLDWMFDVALARQANASFTAAGVRVTYREIADLSHTYPREINREILAWLDRTA